MKCDVIKDLLPLYIDGLASEASKHEIETHLQECEECKAIYEQMKAPIDNINIASPNKEINFLKKIKFVHLNSVLICVVAMLAVFGMLIALFYIGSSVKEEDICYSYEVENNSLWINFELKNGKDLIMRTDNIQKRDEISTEYILTPCEVLHNPFDDVGTEFDYGMDIIYNDSNEINSKQKVTIRFSDKDVVIYPYQVINSITE